MKKLVLNEKGCSKVVNLEKVEKELKELKVGNSKKGKAIKKTAFYLLEDLEEAMEEEKSGNEERLIYFENYEEIRNSIKKILLNGAENWKKWAFGGCGLVYNKDIMELLLTKKEQKEMEAAGIDGDVLLEMYSITAEAACRVIISLCVRNGEELGTYYDKKNLEEEEFLDPRFDSRQSFYKKAKYKIYKIDTVKFTKLFSYGVEVAMITETPTFKRIDVYGKYSSTTSRHIKEFYRQFFENDTIGANRIYKGGEEVVEK